MQSLFFHQYLKRAHDQLEFCRESDIMSRVYEEINNFMLEIYR